VAGEQQPRAGNRHPGKALAPYNVYAAADGHVAIICIREGHWRKLCKAMGNAEIAEDERFSTMTARATNMDEVDALVNAWSSQLTRAEILATTQAHGVICAPVNSLEDVINDPHMAARGSLLKREHVHLGEIAQMQTPLRFRDIDPPALSDAPELGNATASVLAELAGVEAEELAALRAEEAI
jgi:crotonobetainyl-CoA:carnitine CoA-transferase CaiB-like acyl-CoA transferase